MTGEPDAPFRTPAAAGEAELRVKGSRFLARVEPCGSRAAAEARLEEIRRTCHDASHVCWAWRLRAEPEPGEAWSDAGEPSGTAGVPITGALRADDLWDVLGVVVRWFGGTRLGRGGLARAYRDAAAGAVRNAGRIEVMPRVKLEVRVPLDRMGEAHRVLTACGAVWGGQSVQGDTFRVEVTIPRRDQEDLRRALTEATHGTGDVRAAEG
jgi:putative IMPACT (imprinted ancient) family translation regulator